MEADKTKAVMGHSLISTQPHVLQHFGNGLALLLNHIELLPVRFFLLFGLLRLLELPVPSVDDVHPLGSLSAL